MTKKILIARLGDAHGIRGALHLFSYTDPRDNVFAYRDFTTKDGKKIDIVSHKTHADHFTVQLKGCDDRDQALLLKHTDLYIDRDQLPALESGFYWEDLIGLTVIDTHEKVLGIVDHLFTAGENDVIAVKGEKLHYVPYLTHVVLEVNIEKKIILVDWEPLV